MNNRGRGAGAGGGLEKRCPGWKKFEKLTIGGGGGRLFGTREYTSKDKCPNFTNFFRRLKLELKMKLGQLQEEISKASLPEC